MRSCNYSLLVANSQTLCVTSAYFLIADTPYPVILSHSTLLATGLGYITYANHPPGSHILDASSSVDFDNVFSALYFTPDSTDDIPDFSPIDMHLFSIETADTSLAEYQFNVQPFAERIDVTPCADPPNIHDGSFGAAIPSRGLSSLSISGITSSNACRRAPFQHRVLHFSSSPGLPPSSSSFPTTPTSLRDTVDDLLKQGISKHQLFCVTRRNGRPEG
jgi:hypothetical protein